MLTASSSTSDARRDAARHSRRVEFRNLDEMLCCAGRITTTGFARFVSDRMVTAIRTNSLCAAANGVESLRVTPHESHVAWAAFSPLPR